MPGGLHPHAHADSSLLQIAIESFRFSITVVQSPIAALTSFLIQKRDLLKARVIIYAYNQHVWLLSPEPLVVDKPQSTRVEGSQHCYEIKSRTSTHAKRAIRQSVNDGLPSQFSRGIRGE